MARPEIAQLVQSGAQIGAGLVQERRMGDIFEMQKEQVMEEREAAGEINQVFQEEAALNQKRGQGAQVLAQLRKVAAMDPAVRKTQAPVIFQALEQATGTPMSENMKGFLLSAKPEMAGPVFDRMIRAYAQDPNQTIDGLMPILTSPLTSAETIGQISRDLGDVATQEAITGPQPNPRRDKFMQAKATRERLISNLEKVVGRRANTKAAEVAQKKIDQLRGELEKMEMVISGQGAINLGVRPGTTLTESGTGNLSVLQGPDDSGGDSSALGGLRAGDELAMWKMIGPEFGKVIDLDKGIIEFDSPAKKARANEITAIATRMFVDAAGRLTRAEAIQEAKRKAGVSPAAGGVDPNDPYAGF